MGKIIVTIEITGESADGYMDVCDDLVFEDFIGRHNGADVAMVSVDRAVVNDRQM